MSIVEIFQEEQNVSSLALLAKTYASSHADMPIGSDSQSKAMQDYFDIYHPNSPAEARAI